MPVAIQTNLASLEAQRNLNATSKALTVSFTRLSSGYRINSAADDSAGLAISEAMKMQIRSYSVAERNANDGISMTQTAEGALGQMTTLLTRMRELAMQASNGSMSSVDRDYISTEFTQLQAELGRLQDSTTYDGTSLLGTASLGIDFQVGINNASTDRITVTFGNMDLASLRSGTATLVAGTDGLAARDSLDTLDAALKTISTTRANFGAAMNRFDTTISNIQTVRTNISAANSRIRDVDVAEESATMAKNQVLSQAGASVLAQANQLPQLALGLLKG
jgi:flagellin